MPNDPIKHVVVLMLENHSFDQMLGAYKAIYPKLEGIDPKRPRSNRDQDGETYFQKPTTTLRIDPDPMHELDDVLFQMEDENANFIRNYSQRYPDATPEQRQEIMSYYEPKTLPAFNELARHFTICDHWFSSVPGPTWTNRFFVHSGTSKGRVKMPDGAFDPGAYFGYDQDTLYDRLNERNISWHVYYGDVPQSLVLSHQRRPKNAWRYYWLDRFFEHAKGDEKKFPQYSFIEPKYFPPNQNDDHPPHSTMKAQELIAEVYNAIRTRPALWNSTLLVILYDEHGGFYDHVVPPKAVAPDQHNEEYTFDRLGIRVPALLVSPWVKRGVLSERFDHTSLLRYLSDKWDLGPLGARTAEAKSFAGSIGYLNAPRGDTPLSIEVTPVAEVMKADLPSELKPDHPLNGHQLALIAFTEQLEKEIAEPAAKPIREMAMTAGPVAQVRSAKLRVEEFLAQQRMAAKGN